MVLPEFYLDFWKAYDVLRPLSLFVVSVVIYGVFVFHFYRFLARKDIFQLDLSKYNESGHPALRKTVSVIFYFIKSLVMFPLFVAFWFVTLAGLMLLMGRGQSIDGIMLGAMGVVATIRVCAYYNTALSTDIAKILPFALLGIMLIDSTIVQIPESAETIQAASSRIETVTYYLIAVVALEFLLRIVSGIFGYFRRSFTKAAPDSKSADAEIGSVDRARTGAATPAFASRPMYGAPQSGSLESDPVSGRAQPYVAKGATPSFLDAGPVHAGFSDGEGAAGYSGRRLIRNSTLQDSPGSVPSRFDGGGPSR